jgi:hypothetical protein
MNARAIGRRLRRRASSEGAPAPDAALVPMSTGRRASRGSNLFAWVPLLVSLALLVFFVTRPSGAAPIAKALPTAASASMLAHAALPAGSAQASTLRAGPPPPEPDDTVRVFNRRTRTWDETRFGDVTKGSELVHAGALLRVSKTLGVVQWIRDVDVAKLGEADAGYDPKAARRDPDRDDVVYVLGEDGYHELLGSVPPRARLAFQGRVYETQAAAYDARLMELVETGLHLERVTQTFKRRSPTLVDLAVRYGDGREGVLTGTPEHPFFVPARHDYVAMGTLELGTVLRTTDGTTATVAGRTERHGDFEVYNLEVEHAHNYFVSPPGSGGPGVLVHNATYGTEGGKGPPANERWRTGVERSKSARRHPRLDRRSTNLSPLQRLAVGPWDIRSTSTWSHAMLRCSRARFALWATSAFCIVVPPATNLGL